MSLLSPRRLRIALGVLWLLDACLQAQPHLFTSAWWRDDLAQSVMGSPSSVGASILWVVSVVASHPVVWNACFVAAEALIGLGLVSGRFERAAIAASVPLSLGIWWVGEGFGGLPAGFGLLAAGAPGPVLYYPVLGLLAWPCERRPRDSSIVAGVGRWIWVGTWVGGALLELPLRFSPGRVLQANIEESALGEPSWLATIGHHAYSFVGAHPVAVPVLLGLVEIAVGLGVAASRARSAAIALGLVLNAVFWIVFQDLGGILGGATDPGGAPLVALLGLALWQGRPERTAVGQRGSYAEPGPPRLRAASGPRSRWWLPVAPTLGRQ